MIRKEIEKLIKNIYPSVDNRLKIEPPPDDSFGDYATNAAMILGENPKKMADKLTGRIFAKVEVRGGFINFFLSREYLLKQVGKILKEKDEFGNLNVGRKKKVNLEFISANPTGPLTLGNGRGGFCGDALANVMAKAGYRVTREYYINDAGEQVKKLGLSVTGQEEIYRGPQIDDLKKRIKEKDVLLAGSQAAKIILKETIKPAVKRMKIKFDVWFSEKDLLDKGEIEKTLNILEKKNLLYEKDEAFWFKSSLFGDDKDRVLVKKGGQPTYFLSDIAYLRDKFDRGFKKLFFFWGADHFGYIGRMKAASQALGRREDDLTIIIMQLVRLVENGKEVRMSKRSGAYITLEKLVDEVGLDAARFFFLAKAPGTHLNFDLSLAKERSEKNPVYYVQYAYARICSILRKTKREKITATSLKDLAHPSELALAKKLVRFPEIIEDTATDYQIQRLPQYSVEVAAAFHRFYKDCRVISDEEGLNQARLALVSATGIVLKNALSLMGITAPKKM